MKEKTKLKIIEKIAEHLSLEDRFTALQKIAVWTSYLMQMNLFQICLLVSITEPQLHITKTIADYPSVEMGLFLARLIVPIIYLITKSSYFIPAIKLLQMINVYLIRTELCVIPLILQAIAEIFVTLRKEKRNINFDSRLQCKYFGTKIFAVYILLFATFLTPNEEIDKNPAAVLFTSIIYYVAACLDNVYSYKTKQILRNIALCPILMAIYFMCVPLVPAFNTFGTAAHTIVSCSLMFVIVIYAMFSQYSYNHEILNKKILNLQSRDKLLYIWSLIYFSQAPSHNDLICFLKTHQSKCLNSLCPLSFNRSNSKDLSTDFSKESIQSHLKIYLKKSLERFASQSDQVRRLFIYYRKEDDPKIIHLLRQDDIYEKVEEFRIAKNLERYTDVSLEYEQMKEIEEQTLSKVKLYLNHYDYFLTYINKETISMEMSEEIIKEIIKLKNFFLSFKPNSIPQINEEKVSNLSKKSKKKGYEKLDTDTIPVRKMTLKTVVLVNFMRKVYFSLPCLQKQEFSSKKLNYISEDFEQSPILIISAESYNLGKILNWNSMAQKILLYSTKELRTKFINDLLPKRMHQIHEKIFMKAALSIQLGEVRKQLSAFVFCFTKAGYVQIFEVKIQGAHSISGNKWVVEMKQHFDRQAVVVCDENRSVIGVNKNAINFGIAQNVAGETMNQDLFNQLVDQKQQKITISSEEEPIEGLNIEKDTKWQLVCRTPFIEEMPKFYIFLVEYSNDIELMTLSRYGKNKDPIDFDTTPQPKNGFEFNFDPYLLRYSNLPILSHQEADMLMIWQENHSVDESQINEYNFQTSSQRQIINYGENIHEMIYFDSKLEFKENYEIVTEFQTHPHYVPNGRMTVNKNVLRVNISKENFIQNVTKLKQKVPSYLYKLVVIFAIVSAIVIVALALRFLQFKNLYNAAQEKQLISQELINRKNIISNIGSLAVYNNKATIFPEIWQRYLTNNWTYAQLFVQIEYTNGKINKLNNQIGHLVSKSYLVNGKSKTLASYFESLSIEASLESVGQLNLTKFVLEIVDDVEALQKSIEDEFEEYYSKLSSQAKLNIFIIDACQLAACCIAAIFCHVILKKAYNERLSIFKSLSVIEEQEIYRIQKSVSEHREHIKNNELDAIREEDYSHPLESENIPHSKKMLNNYFKDKNLFFYIYIFVFIIVFCGIFPLSQISYEQVQRVQLVNPFIQIIGEQRNSMTKLYLNVITGTKNATWFSSNLMTNVRMFETNKKEVIDSLIAKKFSDKYLNFYNEIWFNPCDVLAVQQQCAEMFSGILSDNLDYNYVYVLTEVQKIVDYRLQSITSPLSLDPQFIKDVNTQIQTSYKKINFLLFEFMTRLHDLFTENIALQVQVLFDFIQKFNLIQFLLLIVGCCTSMSIMVIFAYWIKDLHNITLDMITTVVPYSILMRNQYFAEWYKNKFRNMY